MKRSSIRFGFSVLATAWLASVAGCRTTDAPNQPGIIELVEGASITMYPTVVINTDRLGAENYNSDEARKLGQWLAAEANMTVTHSPEKIRAITQWELPHKGRGREGIAALESHVKAHPVATDYAAVATYSISPVAGATDIYLFMVTDEGELFRWFQADRDQPSFQQANPQTPADCTRLLVNILAERIRLMEKAERLEE